MSKRTRFCVAAMVLVAVLALGCVSAAAVVPPAVPWYAEAVRYVTSRGLMNGVGGGEFAPNASVSRAMTVTVLWRMVGAPEVARRHAFLMWRRELGIRTLSHGRQKTAWSAVIPTGRLYQTRR